MIERHLNGVCFDEIFERQMRFISGPRQVGKTTLAKNFLNHKNFNRLYFKMKLFIIYLQAASLPEPGTPLSVLY